MPYLLEKGYEIVVYDLYTYGDVFKDISNPKIGITMRQQGLGKPEWSHEAPKEKEKEEKEKNTDKKTEKKTEKKKK